MISKRKYLDFILLGIALLSIIFNVYRHLVDGYVLTVNFYMGLVLVVCSIAYEIYRLSERTFVTFILITLSTFNVIVFTAEIVNGKIIELSNGLHYNTLGFNIFIFLILLIYFFINIDFIKSTYQQSPHELIAQKKKLTLFYYEKFSSCDVVEFKEVISKFSSYPKEAQEALVILKTERGL